MRDKVRLKTQTPSSHFQKKGKEMKANIKVQNRFNKEFVNGIFLSEIFKKYPFLAYKIKDEMQRMYDLGHADGFAEGMTNNN